MLWPAPFDEEPGRRPRVVTHAPPVSYPWRPLNLQSFARHECLESSVSAPSRRR